ncbi:MAG: CDGSH iron-sulfur domain-containing protein [Firmicutes bacterium]|nr:CDGSH iron-sulfur domain-containing protein [Bacillota bacterium]
MSYDKKGKIKIVKDGPYIVTGNIPLSEKKITPKGKGYVYTQGKQYEDQETYSLCRCGKTKTPPFCDGSHVSEGFIGDESATKDTYHDRATVLEGPELDLLDDDRCAYARFCHREEGNVWELTLMSDDPDLKSEAIIAAYQCPTGRLVAREKDGFEIDPEFPQSIEILQDPQIHVSCGIFVKGGITLESSDGSTYETRNRYVLCRCGESKMMPFCDASHVTCKFRDK